MPLALRRSASSTAMRPTPQRSMSTSTYPYPYAYLYTYDTLFNNSLGMTSSTAGAPSSSRRRRQRVSGALGLSDDDDSGRRRRTRRGPSSGSLLTNTHTSTSTRPRTRRVASEGSSRQVLAEIEWWRVVQGQRDPNADFDLDVEEDADDEDTPGLDTEDVSDNAEDEDMSVYSPSIPPLTRARSHAHAQDDFTLTHSFSAHSRTSSSSSSDSELELQHRIPRGSMPFPTSGLKFNCSTLGGTIFPSTSLSLVDDEHDDINDAEFNEVGSASVSTPNAIVKAALATLFPSSSTSSAELTSTCSSSSQPLGFSLSIPILQHDTSDVGVYTPALPQSSRVRAISLPEASNVGVTAKTKHSKLPGPFSDDMFSEALGNL